MDFKSEYRALGLHERQDLPRYKGGVCISNMECYGWLVYFSIGITLHQRCLTALQSITLHGWVIWLVGNRNRIRIGSRHCLPIKGWDCGVNWGSFGITTRLRIRQIYLFTVSIIKFKSGEKPRYTLTPSRLFITLSLM